MKFTVELRPLVKMIETVGKKMPAQKRCEPTLRLFACEARGFEQNHPAPFVVGGFQDALQFLQSERAALESVLAWISMESYSSK